MSPTITSREVIGGGGTQAVAHPVLADPEVITGIATDTPVAGTRVRVGRQSSTCCCSPWTACTNLTCSGM